MHDIEDDFTKSPLSHGLLDTENDEETRQMQDAAAATVERDACGYYARLGVATSATPQQLRRAFLDLSQRYHTDKHVGGDAAVQAHMSARFKELQEAYTVLMDARQRAVYDAAGLRGAQYLALVPANATDDTLRRVVQHIQYLEQSAKLRKMADLLAFQSQLRVHYNLQPLQSLPLVLSRAWQAAVRRESDEPSPKTTSSTPDTTAAATTNGKETSESTAPDETLDAQQNNFTPAEIEINGERQLVLIPSPAVQRKLRALAAQHQFSPSSDAQPDQAQGVAARRSHGVPVQLVVHTRLALALLQRAVLPRTVSAEYGFRHVFGPRLSARVRVWGQTTPKKPMGVRTTLQHKCGHATYSLTARTTLSEMKTTLQLDRALSPLWRLQAALVLFKSFLPLSKLKLSLERALSEHTVLQNTLALSWLTQGYFRSSMVYAQRGTSGVATVTMSQDALTLVLRAELGRVYGVQLDPAPMRDELPDATAEEVTPGPPVRVARGVDVLQLSTLSTTGVSTVQYEMWYFHSALQHYGVAFSASLPAAFSPLSTPYGLSWARQPWALTSLSLLYRRGQNSVTIPITLAASSSWARVVGWVVVPMLTYRVATRLYRGYSAKAVGRYYVAARRRHVAEVDVGCARARAEQGALEAAVLRARAVEEAAGGLVIVNARYGVLTPQYVDAAKAPPSQRGRWRVCVHAALARCGRVAAGCVRRVWRRAEKDATELVVSEPIADAEIDLVLDVTVALQNLVHDSALTLPSGSKAGLVGFCDPDPYTAERKQLKVVYRFDRRPHQVVFDDLDEVQLPQRSHRVEG